MLFPFSRFVFNFFTESVLTYAKSIGSSKLDVGASPFSREELLKRVADVKAENEGNSHETCEPHPQEKDEQTVQKPIWNHFLKQSGTFRAICKHCLLELSIRDGRRSSSINTTAIKRHLQAKHPKEFRKFKGKKNKNIYIIVFIRLLNRIYLQWRITKWPE